MTREQLRDQRLMVLLTDTIRDCDIDTAHAVCAVLVTMIPPERLPELTQAIRLALTGRQAALPHEAAVRTLRAFEPIGLAH